MRMNSAYRQIERSLQRREEQRSREERLEREQKKTADAQRHAEYLNEQLEVLDGAFRARRATLRVRSTRTDHVLELRWDTGVGVPAVLGWVAATVVVIVGIVVVRDAVFSAISLFSLAALLALAVLWVVEAPKMSELHISADDVLVEELLESMRTGDSAEVSLRVRALLRRQPGTKVTKGTSLLRQWRSGVRRGA
ncbi:hypothetical protein NHL51_01160 [Leucobacter sp. gxy201]|uniref:hypothetical protein n=1 Tax=Leucobacter sp. gxy201 TaxID=2957200 RepID=UPI003DA15481